MLKLISSGLKANLSAASSFESSSLLLALIFSGLVMVPFFNGYLFMVTLENLFYVLPIPKSRNPKPSPGVMTSFISGSSGMKSFCSFESLFRMILIVSECKSSNYASLKCMISSIISWALILWSLSLISFNYARNLDWASHYVPRTLSLKASLPCIILISYLM